MLVSSKEFSFLDRAHSKKLQTYNDDKINLFKETHPNEVYFHCRMVIQWWSSRSFTQRTASWYSCISSFILLCLHTLYISWHEGWKPEWFNKKSHPLLGKGWQTRFHMKKTRHTHCFLCSPCQGYILWISGRLPQSSCEAVTAAVKNMKELLSQVSSWQPPASEDRSRFVEKLRNLHCWEPLPGNYQWRWTEKTYCVLQWIVKCVNLWLCYNSL
jgi:hypothetical protein